MSHEPDPNRLLDAVLAEAEEAGDSLPPLLRAVRARRRRQQATAVAGLLALALLGSLGLAGRFHRTQPTEAGMPMLAPRFVSPAAPAELVTSRPLAPGERVTTLGSAPLLTRIHSRPDDGLTVSDAELLNLAGGRGVGLFRIDGRVELLVAGTGEVPGDN
jgi:hypothetical protein